jgi:hypothetical protein
MPEEVDAPSVAHLIQSTSSHLHHKAIENISAQNLNPRFGLGKEPTRIDKLTREEWSLVFHELDLTQYHEAGHAIAFYLFNFHPIRIAGATIVHDRRSTAFFRTRGGLLQSPLARQRAQNYAVCCIAGIAAESKFAGVPLADLRRLSGKEDYEAVHAIGHRLAICGGIESSPETTAAHISLWESRAIALMDHPQVWAAVEAVYWALHWAGGELEGLELVEEIKHGLHGEWNRSRASKVSNLR